MSALESIHKKLNSAQAGFFRAADAIQAERWSAAPAAGEWSAAELVCHLVVVERGILSNADKVLQKAPKEISFREQFHLPVWLVESRLIRRKSPVPQDPELIGEKETMLAELRGARERTLAFLAETESRELSRYCWRHPFLGYLNTYEWMEMIAAHQVRHTKQMREIEAKLFRKV